MAVKLSGGFLPWIGSVVRQITPEQYHDQPFSKEETFAAAGMSWQVRDADPTYEQALAMQQAAALAALRQQREARVA